MSQSYNVIYIDLSTGQEFYSDRVIQDGVIQYVCVQSSPAYVWVLNHNQNTNKFVIKILNNNVEIIPKSIVVNDNNTISVTFTKPTAGKVLLMMFDVSTSSEITPTPTSTPILTSTPTPTITPTTTSTPTPTITPTPVISDALTFNVTNATGYKLYACGASNNASIDWGDGTITIIPDSALDGNDDMCNNGITHTYNITGNYVINIYGDYSTGIYMYLLDDDPGGSSSELLSWGSYNIAGAINLPGDIIAVPTSIPASLTDLGFMFQSATAFNQDISSWNTSNVTYMDGMFQNATTFNQDISSWNTSNVTTMNSMFYSTTAFNQDISSWNTSNVTTMNSMFYSTTAFNQDLSHWCVTNITSAPPNFDSGAPAWTLPKPVWGTCPA